MELDQIETIIYILRDQKVMIDSDLATLYGVETKVFNQAVKRNIKRFPEDFMFIPNSSELALLRSQIVTLKGSNAGNHFTYAPKVFTENGIAMLSGILHGQRAIDVNITIMRLFTKLRHAHNHTLKNDFEINELKSNTAKVFKLIFNRIDQIEDEISLIKEVNLTKRRRKIGLKT